MEPYVTFTVENNVGTIEFFHPSHNALPSNLLDKLVRVFNKADKDETIKVVVFKSGGDRTFCAGANFQELLQITNKDEGTKFFSGFANVINAMRKCSKIIIGRVQGKAVGGGVGLAAATDYCLASNYAAVKLSELSIGIGPFVIEPAVSRKIGLNAFTQLTLNPDLFFNSEWAANKGLYNSVFESIYDMDKAVADLATKLCSCNSEALKQLKSVLWKNTDNWDELLIERAKLSGKLILSEEAQTTLQKYAS
jgi:methylglutaconyl-CoA hydratase